MPDPKEFTRAWFVQKGAEGGHKRASRLTPEARREISRRAGIARALAMGQKLRPPKAKAVIPPPSDTPTP